MRGAFLVLLLLLLPGCPAGVIGETITPKARTAQEALGEEATCRKVADHAQPLIVDWKAHQRSELELAMKGGVAVVSYTCERFQLLSRCRVAGSYGFAGVGRKEDVVQLNSRDEVRANLPLNGVSIGAEMERGSTIDLALVTIGKKVTTVSSAAVSELEGDCEGATHIVRGAFIGAFAMDRGEEGMAKAAAEIFGAGVAGATDNKRRQQNKDGQIDACKASNSNDETPPDQCQAALRLELAPVTKKRSDKAASGLGAKKETKAKKNPCPEGMVLSGSKCTKPAKATAYLCEDNDLFDCKKQCDAGDVDSCYNLALLYRSDRANLDKERSLELAKGACKKDHAEACTLAGLVDESGRRPLFERGCELGDGKACIWTFLFDKKLSNLMEFSAEEIPYLLRACDLGEAGGCALYGHAFIEGLGVEKDVAKGIAVLERSCEGDGTENCEALARMYEKGEHVEASPVKRLRFLEIACERGRMHRCYDVGKLYLDGAAGVAADKKRAEPYLKRACFTDGKFGYVVKACADLGKAVRWDNSKRAVAFKAYMRACKRQSDQCVSAAYLANEIVIDKLSKQCTDGDGVACEELSVRLLKRACLRNEKKACDELEREFPAQARKMWETYCAKSNWDPERRSCKRHVDFGGTLPKRRRRK